MSYKLMIKTHNQTGLKYLCKNEQSGKRYDRYKGSGKYWTSHLKKHGGDISTVLLFETDDLEEFRKFALAKSIELNVVDSDEWANLKHEEGDGGAPPNHGGWKLSPERRAQISEANRNRRVSDETKAKMSASHKGHKSTAKKGYIFTEEQRARLSAAQRRRFGTASEVLPAGTTLS